MHSNQRLGASKASFLLSSHSVIDHSPGTRCALYPQRDFDGVQWEVLDLGEHGMQHCWGWKVAYLPEEMESVVPIEYHDAGQKQGGNTLQEFGGTTHRDDDHDVVQCF